MPRKTAAEPAGNGADLAKFINLSLPQCYNLANSGTIPKPDNGVWNIGLCANAYIKYLQGRAGEEKRGYAVERTRLTRGQADKVEMEIQVLQGQLLPVETVQTVWSQILGACRSRLLGLPSRLAAVALSAESYSDVEQHARDLVDEALNELADFQPELYRTSRSRAAHLFDGAPESQATAEAHHQRMGEPEPAPVPRRQRRTRPVSH